MVSTITNAQQMKFVDLNFHEYNGDSIVENSDYTIFVTDKSCRSCTEYLSNTEVTNSVIFVVQKIRYSHLGILQSSTNLNNVNIFFVLVEDLKKYVDLPERSPILLTKIYEVIQYDEIKQLSNDFSLREDLFISNLMNH